MASAPLCDLSVFQAAATPLFTLDDIRSVNPQRFEMEQLTAIVHVDQSQHLLAGYKQLTHEEFWIRGHMPGFALMPGVVQCEAAAQLGGFYAQVQSDWWRLSGFWWHERGAVSQAGVSGDASGPDRQSYSRDGSEAGPV